MDMVLYLVKEFTRRDIKGVGTRGCENFLCSVDNNHLQILSLWNFLK